jgi:hypothetical protein
MLCELFVKMLSFANLHDAVGIPWLGGKKVVTSDQLLPCRSASTDYIV